MKYMVVDTEVYGLPIESPLVYARQLAQAEMRAEITPEERGWLANNPLLWLRALGAMREDTQHAIGRDREYFKSRWPEPLPNTAEFRAAKSKHAELRARRRHFLKAVVQRIDQMKVALGKDLADAPLAGEIVDMFLDIVRAIDEGRPDGARTIALRRADQLARIYGFAEPPDNSEASPVGMILPRDPWDGFFYCRGCHAAPLTTSETVCPRCKQRHEISFTTNPVRPSGS